jgi:predicted lipid-binding transport protein (Tim44 family)
MENISNIENILNYIDIFLLLFLTIFLFVMFRKVLGKKVGYQKNNDNINEQINKQMAQILAKEEVSGNIYPEGSLAYKIREIEILDSSFKQKKFLDSAKLAFSMIINKYYTGDFDEMKKYTSEKVFKVLSSSIANRIEKDLKIFVEVKNINIVNVEKIETQYFIEVKLLLDQTKSNTINKPLEVVQNCKFMKDYEQSNNENIWLLVEVKNN